VTDQGQKAKRKGGGVSTNDKKILSFYQKWPTSDTHWMAAGLALLHGETNRLSKTFGCGTGPGFWCRLALANSR
jgi:hypothetical protein